jgi:predicted secreted protein
MAAQAGYLAIVQIGNTPVTITGVKTADLTIQGDIYDITDLNNNQWKKKLGGLADYSLKLGGNYDMSDTQQASLQASIITTPGATVTWKVWPAGTGGTHNYSGTGIIKQQAVKIDVSKEQTIEFDIEGSGALTYV